MHTKDFWQSIVDNKGAIPADAKLDDLTAELLEYLRHNGNALTNIRESKVFDDDTAEALRSQIAEFKQGFQTSEGKLLAGREEYQPLEEEDVNQEQIVKQKR